MRILIKLAIYFAVAYLYAYLLGWNISSTSQETITLFITVTLVFYFTFGAIYYGNWAVALDELCLSLIAEKLGIYKIEYRILCEAKYEYRPFSKQSESQEQKSESAFYPQRKTLFKWANISTIATKREKSYYASREEAEKYLEDNIIYKRVVRTVVNTYGTSTL